MYITPLNLQALNSNLILLIQIGPEDLEMDIEVL